MNVSNISEQSLPKLVGSVVATAKNEKNYAG